MNQVEVLSSARACATFLMIKFVFYVKNVISANYCQDEIPLDYESHII